MQPKRELTRIGRWLNSRGDIVMLFVACISLGVREWLPFSRSPMYTQPPVEASYFFVSDLDDHPIPTQKELGVRCSRLRKAFLTYRSRESGPAEAREQRAAVRTLRFAVDHRPGREKGPGYRLWRVDIKFGKNGVVRDKRVVAQWP